MKKYYYLVFVLILCSCNKKDNNDIPKDAKVTSSGIKYVFHTKNTNQKTYQKDQYISYHLRVQTENETLFNSFENTNQQIKQLILPDSTLGSEWEMFYQCAEGDSLEFWIAVDSLKNKSGILHPKIMESEGYVHFTLKVLKIETQEDVEKNQKSEFEDVQAQNKLEIENYIKKDSSFKNIKSTSTGLHYQINKVGKGDSAYVGDTVLVHFTARLLNGKVLDSSQNRGEATELVLGKDSDVIKGLDEGIRLLKEGGNGKFLIPSHLGYGTQGITNVVPKNAVLSFEVELIEIR